MIVVILQFILIISIMYQCCKKLPCKTTWLIYVGISIVCNIIFKGFFVFSNFWLNLGIIVVESAFMVWVYYKIYEYCNQSFAKFAGFVLLFHIAMFCVLSIIQNKANFMTWTMVQAIVTIFIMYPCCKKLDYKISWLIYTAISILFCGIAHKTFYSWGYFLGTVIVNLAVGAFVTWIYYKIYKHCDDSFAKFLGCASLLQIVIFIILQWIILISCIIVATPSIQD